MPERRSAATRPARVVRRIAAVTLFALSSAVVVPGTAAAAQRIDTKVSVKVIDVSPSTPTISHVNKRKLTITLSLTNITNEQLDDITITGIRGGALTTQGDLDAALATPVEKPFGDTITTEDPVTTSLAGGQSTTIEFATTTNIPLDAGICLCTRAGVYPLYFTATVGDEPVGSTQTYLPAFFEKPAAENVTWLWPLIDRPHRLSSDTAFTDDDLASSIAGGRLDRMLHTLELLEETQPDTPMTLVLDPELLDELLVMSDAYTIQAPGTDAQPGTGKDAAAAYLDRLRDVLDTDPAMTLAFTPFADPDVESVFAADLPLNPMPAAMASRVSAWLGTRVAITDFAWPIAGAMTHQTATRLAAAGYRTVLVGPGALAIAALAPDGGAVGVTTPAGELSVLSTSKPIRAALQSAVTAGASPDAVQVLAAQLAIRIAPDNTRAQNVVLAAPRTLDPAPDVAAKAIATTTSAFWLHAQALTDSVAPTAGPVGMSSLNHPFAAAPRLPPTTLVKVQVLNGDIDTLTSLFGANSQNPVVGALPAAIQRAESSAWTSDPAASDAFIEQLAESVRTLKTGVFIVHPSSGSYTLASSDSRLPLTIQNDLDFAVQVVPTVIAKNSLPGFSAVDQVKTVEPHSKLAIRVPVRVERSGRIQVVAQLFTTTKEPIGLPVELSVSSTALGRIGLIITIVSGVVLALALLRRFWSRLRKRKAAGAAA